MNRNLEKAYNQVAHELAHYQATRGNNQDSESKDRNLLRKYEEKILIMQEENQKMADCVRELDHTLRHRDIEFGQLNQRYEELMKNNSNSAVFDETLRKELQKISDKYAISCRDHEEKDILISNLQRRLRY